MDLSDPLIQVTRHLLRDPSGFIAVHVHEPQERTKNRFIVVCEWEKRSGHWLRASGVAGSRVEAYVKAIAELGEVALCDRDSLPDRSGIAAGFIEKNAVVRAKSELIERDAFLFHYRTGTPFLRREPALDASEAVLFEMSSADLGYVSLLAVDRASLEGRRDCILLGLGCHPDRGVAASKAIGELACATLDHAMRPGWCKDIYEGNSPAKRLTDRHHAASRDPRNLERMGRLFAVRSGSVIGERVDCSKRWEIVSLESPLRYMRYFKATNDALAVLEFGRPESWTDSGSPPLFHPIW